MKRSTDELIYAILKIFPTELAGIEFATKSLLTSARSPEEMDLFVDLHTPGRDGTPLHGGEGIGRKKNFYNVMIDNLNPIVEQASQMLHKTYFSSVTKLYYGVSQSVPIFLQGKFPASMEEKMQSILTIVDPEVDSSKDWNTEISQFKMLVARTSPDVNNNTFHMIQCGKNQHKTMPINCSELAGHKFAQSPGVDESSVEGYFATVMDKEYGAIINMIDQESKPQNKSLSMHKLAVGSSINIDGYGDIACYSGFQGAEALDMIGFNFDADIQENDPFRIHLLQNFNIRIYDMPNGIKTAYVGMYVDDNPSPGPAELKYRARITEKVMSYLDREGYLSRGICSNCSDGQNRSASMNVAYLHRMIVKDMVRAEKLSYEELNSPMQEGKLYTIGNFLTDAIRIFVSLSTILPTRGRWPNLHNCTAVTEGLMIEAGLVQAATTEPATAGAGYFPVDDEDVGADDTHSAERAQQAPTENVDSVVDDRHSAEKAQPGNTIFTASNLLTLGAGAVSVACGATLGITLLPNLLTAGAVAAATKCLADQCSCRRVDNDKTQGRAL